MHKSTSLAQVQDIVLALEDLFYVFKKVRNGTDFEKLSPESENYDGAFADRVRRPEMGTIILLDQILYVQYMSMLESAQHIDALERLLFSPAFYRTLLFGGTIRSFIPLFEPLYKNFVLHRSLFDDIITSEIYMQLIEDFPNLPPTREEFVSQLEAVQNLLDLKKRLFDQEFSVSFLGERQLESG